jgi:hypothetical protein
VNLGDTGYQNKNQSAKNFLRYILVIITGTRDLPQSLSKIEMGFEKGNHANHAARDTEKDRKIVVYQLLAFAIGDGLQNVTEILVR